MSCKSKKCVHYSDYFYWYTFRVGDVKNLYNLCDTDLMPGMPDPCSRCKRAYRDAFIGKVCRTPVSKHGVFISNIGLGL